MILAAGTGLTMTTALAAVPTSPEPDSRAQARVASKATGHPGRASETPGFYDVRLAGGTAGMEARLKTSARGAQRPATRALRVALGDSALVDIDGVTGTPRLIGKLDGYLTAASSLSPQAVAKKYVKDNLAAFGLATSDLASFRFRDDYVDVLGTHHLSWTQVFDGTELFGYGLQASVTKKGRLLTIGGSPVPGSLLTPRPATARLSSTDAISAARRDGGESTLRPGPRDSATRVLVVTRKATYLGWRSVTMSADQPTVSVHDAVTGRLLYRRPLGQDERGAQRAQSKGVAFEYFPKAPHGGSYLNVNYTKKRWLSGTATILSGNNSHAYSDVNDDNRANKGEEVGPKSGHTWSYRLKPFHLGMSFCDNPYPCSWNPNKAFSWKTNRAQNTAQVFFFVNNFHDYLLKAPIGFTEDAGNFEQKNSSGKGRGKDAVDTQTMDGANTNNGLPDGAHVDNANMNTPPDGIAPTMQMYLQHEPGTSYPGGDPFPAVSTGDEGDTVYHEYAHGLSNRLVIDPTGFSSLGGVQGGSMGEAWSDYYAFDYLVKRHLLIDGPGVADVDFSDYDGAGQALVRTEEVDCKVDSPGTECPGADSGHPGGYTYADYAKIIGYAEVHSDGEIWGQTLWDLREALGHDTTVALVTRAMELAPYNPSFLDMRNAILMADTNAFGGSHQTQIWSVFATRGMGYFAGSLGGDDATPAASFETPPVSGDTGTITGTITDTDTGLPVAGVPVTLAFQGGNTAVNPTAVTAADGTYTLGPVAAGTYEKLVVSGAGFEPTQTSVTVTTSGAVQDFTVRRDWAAASGGASVARFNGPDYTPYGCGPGEAIDLSLASGWGSTTGANSGAPTNVMKPKRIVIALPQAVDVSAVAVDPAATCGDGGSASLGLYEIALSPDGVTWTVAAAGEFVETDRGRLNELTPTAGATDVEYVRLTMLGNQTPSFDTSCPDGAFSGCSYTDLSEIAVYGVSAAP